MNILLVSEWYYPEIGGVATVVSELAKKYVSLGHNVYILTSKIPRNAVNYEVINDVKVYRTIFFERERGPSKWLVRPFFHALKFYKNLVIEKKIDIIHHHYCKWIGLYTFLIKKMLDIPILLTMHGTDYNYLPYNSLFFKHIIPFLVNKFDAVTVVSNDGKRKIQKLKKITKKISVVYNGIEPDLDYTKVNRLNNIKITDNYFISIGVLIKRKGFDLIIKAFKTIAVKYPDVKYIIIGGGPELKNLMNLVKENNLVNRVIFTGYLKNNEIIPIIKNAKFLIHAPKEEPFGIVLLEAMIFNKAVFASRVGGIPEIIVDNVTGKLFKPNSVISIMNIIDYAMTNPIKLDKFGNAGRKRVLEKFNWNIIARDYLDIYHKILY